MKTEKQIAKRKAYMKKYLREYHRLPKMVDYMKKYHEDPEHKAAAKKRRQTPERKASANARNKIWRMSEAGKKWRKEYVTKNKDRMYSNHRRYYHKHKNVATEKNSVYSKAYSEDRQ